MKIVDWGLIDYPEASARQLQLVENFSGDQIIICTHPPVVTTGRGTRPGDVFSWQGHVHETNRGGRATYHGPSQIIAYPIIDLNEAHRAHIQPRDLHSYMRALENSIVATLREFQIFAEARTVKADVDSPSLTGVWVADKKIASIGIAVKKWITYHGLALNFSKDETAFQGINPCGFQSPMMTSVEESNLGPAIDRTNFQKTLQNYLKLNLCLRNSENV